MPQEISTVLSIHNQPIWSSTNFGVNEFDQDHPSSYQREDKHTEITWQAFTVRRLNSTKDIEVRWKNLSHYFRYYLENAIFISICLSSLDNNQLSSQYWGRKPISYKKDFSLKVYIFSEILDVLLSSFLK